MNIQVIAHKAGKAAVLSHGDNWGDACRVIDHRAASGIQAMAEKMAPRTREMRSDDAGDESAVDDADRLAKVDPRARFEIRRMIWRGSRLRIAVV